MFHSYFPSAKKIFSSFIVLILGIIVLAFLLRTWGKVIMRNYEINKEISRLQTEIENLEKSNKELSQLIEYLQTESFKEREARLRLNLQKLGEKVIVISPPEVSEIVKKKEKEKETNFLKWWKYFFENP